MNYKAVFTYLAYIMRIEAAAMLPSLGIAIYLGEKSCVLAFGVTIAALCVISLLQFCFKAENKTINNQEGLVIVALSWIVISLFGAIPFTVSGYVPSYIDAFFETVSGFTTTGATILTDVEALSRSLIFWRSFTHWLGGMGVLVLMLAIVSLSGGGGDSIFILQAESPGPTTDKLVPRLKKSAGLLYKIYLAMTVIQVILLLIGGMPLFDALVHTFGTAGTGGFSMMNKSIGAYDSYYLQAVISIFMLLFGVNFNIYYLLLTKQFKKAFKDSELLLYLGIVFSSVLIIAFNIRSMFPSFFQAIHHSLFQVSSVITTTGYSTVDFDQWPMLSECILIFLMFVGACAGSTGGGLKVSRLLVLLKAFKNGLQKRLHPRSVKVMHINGKPVSDATVQSILVYLAAYVFILIISVILVSIDNADFESTFTGIMACYNNIGPGFGIVGPAGNFSTFSGFSKIVLSADMLLGRLEIYPLLLLFSPMSWKRSLK